MTRGPVLLRGDARALPLPDESVDLVCTSPPYFGLRDYGYDGQIGSEPTPREFVDALIACTAEMVRVLKPSGSIFVNLGDKYAGGGGQWEKDERPDPGRRRAVRGTTPNHGRRHGLPAKSLMMIPERYRIRAVDELGLIARAVLVWSKPNGLPESVTDRVRRSHEDWVHLTRSPRYFSAVDEIRESSTGYARTSARRDTPGGQRPRAMADSCNPLGRLPGSVWEIPSQPLNVPDGLDTDHYAAFPMEWPRRLISGWSPREVCTACGEGRRPVVDRERWPLQRVHNGHTTAVPGASEGRSTVPYASSTTITGYACACPDTTALTTPGVVLDPFGGTGTTALVAHMLGRRGISVDLSEDYQRIARWRCHDPKERARAAGLDPDQVAKVTIPAAGQTDLFDGLDEVSA